MIRTFLIALSAALLLAPFPAAAQESGAQVFGHWTVRCDVPEGGARKCEMFQRLLHKEIKLRVAEFAIGFPADAAAADADVARGVVVLPHGIMLQDGVKIRVDNNQPYRFVVKTCLADGCYGYLSLNDFLLGKMREGNEVTFSFNTADGEPFEITLSLKGFSSALDAIRKSL